MEYDRLKSKCMGLEEELVNLLRPYQRSRETWYGISSKMTEAKDVMARMGGALDWTEKAEFDGGKAFRDSEQELWDSQLAAGEPGKQNLNRIQDTMQDLRDRTNEVNPSSPRSVFKPCLTRGIADLKECNRLLLKTRFTSNSASIPLPAPLSPVAQLLKSLVTSASVVPETKFTHVDEVIKRSLFNVEEAKEEQAILSSEGKIKEVEKQYKQILAKQEACCEILNKKITDATGLEAELLDAQQRAVHVLDAAELQFADVVSDHAELQRQCTEDHMMLLKHSNVQQDAHDDIMGSLRGDIASCEQVLEENTARQNEIWMKIAARERELNKLARERYTEVQKWVHLTEESEKNRAVYAKFTSWVGGRQKLLQETIQQCENVAKVVKYLKNFILNRKTTLNGYYGALTERLSGVKENAHRKFLEVFKEMYLTSGELHAKKTQLLLKMNEDLQNEQMKLALCQESFDPAAKTHADKIRTLETGVQELRTVVNALENKQTLYLEWFKPTEAALLIQPSDSSHPVAALTAWDSQRKAKITAYKQLMSSPPSAQLLPAPPAADTCAPLDWAVKRAFARCTSRK